ncbi:hypothetical protein ACNZ5P_001892, partial [Campylobacter jejuni]
FKSSPHGSGTGVLGVLKGQSPLSQGGIYFHREVIKKDLYARTKQRIRMLFRAKRYEAKCIGKSDWCECFFNLTD